MLSKVFAQLLPRSSNTVLLAFNTAHSRVPRWSIPDPEIPCLTSYRRFGCSRSNFAALDRTSFDCHSMSNVPLPKDCPAPQLLTPSIYQPMTHSWRPLPICFRPGGLPQRQITENRILECRFEGPRPSTPRFFSYGPSERSFRRPTTSAGHHALRGTQPVIDGHSRTLVDQKEFRAVKYRCSTPLLHPHDGFSPRSG